MNKKEIINLVNLIILMFGLYLNFTQNSTEIKFLSIGFCVVSIINLLYNNID